MGNCLVTKLKGTVDNPNLPRLGEIKFKILEEENFTGKWLLIRSTGDPITIEAHGAGSFTVDDDPTVKTTFTTSDTGSHIIKFSNGTYDVSLIGKYSLQAFSQQGDSPHTNMQIEFNIEDLQYSPVSSITCWGNRAIYGNIDVLDKSRITLLSAGYCSNLSGTWTGFPEQARVSVPGTNIGGPLAEYQTFSSEIFLNDNASAYGSLDDLAGRTNLTIFSATRCYGITGGHIEALGTNPGLANLVLSELRDYSGFNGSVEAFVAAQVAAGRTTCPISDPIACPWLLYAATFGGNKYNVASYMYLTWDSASKITIYQGASGAANCPNIYAKGATAQEIAAWEQAGKTVIEIS